MKGSDRLAIISGTFAFLFMLTVQIPTTNLIFVRALCFAGMVGWGIVSLTRFD